MFDAYSALELLTIAGLGLLAGTLGGMLGVGGSVVMIPGLVWLLGRPTGVEQHLYQAAAMIANVAVAVPAALRHRRAGAMVPAVLRGMLPAALGGVILGVWLSNLPVFSGPRGGVWLGRVLAAFLVYVIYANLKKLCRPAVAPQPPPPPPPPAITDKHTDPPAHDAAGQRAPAPTPTPVHTDGTDDTPDTASAPLSPAGGGVAVGSLMGTTAGLMGVGGGALAVPLQQTLIGLPLRQCIANSSAVICVSAAVGAIYKNATLAGRVGPEVAATLEAAGQPAIDWRTGLALGLLLAPTAWAGGRLGAALTHRLPLRTIRVAFIALMLVAAWKMAALPT